MISPHVQVAIGELGASFPGSSVLREPDGSGGARVLIEQIALSPTYAQSDTWLGAHIPVQIPYADVYPLFVRGDLARKDGRSLGEAMAPGHSFMNRAAVQVSRRTNARDPSVETPTLKFLKVIEWIRARP